MIASAPASISPVAARCTRSVGWGAPLPSATRQNNFLARAAGVPCLLAAWLALAAPAVLAQSTPVAFVRHAPALNGSLDGSLQVMSAEGFTLNGGASVSGDLLVPGTPTVRLNGNTGYGGTLDGAGAATPSNYQITLNGGAALRHVVRRTDPLALPMVTAPPPPSGTRSVSINNAGQSAGDFSTLRHLTLNGGVGQLAIPPGAYGDFTANGDA